MSIPLGPNWALCHIGLKFPGATLAACVAASFLVMAPDPTPMVAITFDDGYESVLVNALPEMEYRNMVGTSYISTGFLNRPGYINESDISTFTDANWEIGAHTVTHPDLTQLSIFDLHDELVPPIPYLSSVSGQEVLSFASPYGSYNDEVIEYVEKLYFNHVNAWSDSNGINTLEEFDPYDVHRQDVSSSYYTRICDTLNNLPENSLYVLVMHDVVNSEDIDSVYDTSIEKFNSILTCVEKSGVNVVRLSDGVQTMIERLK